MTEFFHFDRLTWPEIAALSRSIPLVLPLGSGYNLESLVDALGDPHHAGLLPAFPFGWQGSGLAVPEQVLSDILANLLDSLRDDGFTRLFVLAPQGLNLSLGAVQICQPHKSQYFQQPALPADAERDKVIVIPIGHTEQHGFHLPMATDTIIIEAIGQGTAQATPDLASCLPVMPYGVSTHRAAFAGTLNCGGRAFEDFWLAVIDGLVHRGFERFYLLSGHGGNCSFLVNIIKYAGERHKQIFCATSWLYLSGPKGIEALEKYRQSPIGGMGHACELETSLILHLTPDQVHMERTIDEMDFIATPNYYMDWVEGGALIANPPWDDDTRTGAYGAGSLGTAEKGRVWLDAAVAEKVVHVTEIHQQLAMRKARRASGFGLWGNAQDFPHASR